MGAKEQREKGQTSLISRPPRPASNHPTQRMREAPWFLQTRHVL